MPPTFAWPIVYFSIWSGVRDQNNPRPLDQGECVVVWTLFPYVRQSENKLADPGSRFGAAETESAFRPIWKTPIQQSLRRWFVQKDVPCGFSEMTSTFVGTLRWWVTKLLVRGQEVGKGSWKGGELKKSVRANNNQAINAAAPWLYFSWGVPWL